MRILIAEDDPTSLLMLRTVVAGWGLEPVAVDNGTEAWRLLESEESPPIAILDREMPGLTGLELCQRERALHPDHPAYLILLTARGEKLDVVDGLNAGANDYISKPFDLNELRARVAVGKRVVELQQALARRVREVEEAKKREDELRMKVEALGGWLGAKGEVISGNPASLARLADEIAEAVGAAGIMIYAIRDGKLILFTEKPGVPFVWPALLESVVKSAELLQIPGYLFLPLQLPHGPVLGVLVVHGLGRNGLLPEELNMVKRLGREVASGLELSKLRNDIEELSLERRHRQQSGIGAEDEKLAVCPSCMKCFTKRQEKCPVDGHPLLVLPDVPFEVAGRYRFERRLGVGGMGMVFGAFDSQLNRRVALKIIRLRQSLMDTERSQKRFAAEAQVLAGINHPGVVTLHDSGELGSGTMYLVTELLQGMDLEQILSHYGPATPAQAALLIQQTGEALQAAHVLGLVHRDIKPANIFVLPAASGFRVKLIDFGLARSESSPHVTQESCVVGTPRYLAAEIFRGAEASVRSDLYSLAAVAYETLTGTPVVKSREIADIVMDVLTSEPEPLSSLIGDSAKALDSWFTLGLSKEPGLRPQSVAEWTAAVVSRLTAMKSTHAGWPRIQTPSGPINVTKATRPLDGSPSTETPVVPQVKVLTE